MNNTKTPSTGTIRLMAIFITGILILGSVAGCRSGNFGRIAHNREVTDMFNNLKIPPEPRYYYSGPDAQPRAFIGVNPEFTLESQFWKPVALDPPLLRSWLEFRGRGDRADFSANLYGAYILGPNDERIGYWYSIRNWSSVGTVKMGEGNVVHITTPNETQSNRKRGDM